MFFNILVILPSNVPKYNSRRRLQGNTYMYQALVLSKMTLLISSHFSAGISICYTMYLRPICRFRAQISIYIMNTSESVVMVVASSNIHCFLYCTKINSFTGS